jgi:outer membrane receptor protein involved in Fe transport
MTFVRRAVVGAFCLFVASAAYAQVTTADILGRVTDSSGAVLPGVSVTVVNTATRDTRTQTTNDTGDYVFNLLPIGTYAVTVELQGFQTQTTNLRVASGDRARFDPKLGLGTVNESIQVTAEAAVLQTDTATVGALFTDKAVQDLPVAGRNIVRLVQMIPGASEGQVSSLANGTRPDDRRQTSSVSINGTADTQNNQLLDGMDNNERAIGTVGVKPSIDAIAEVKVQTNLYSAETGRTLGGVINILTKSGSNSFHGTAYDYVRNDRFDARSYFAATKPKLTQNQFGGSIGGPIRTDKTFFFVDYEGFRSTQGVANLITVPTARMRAGDFSELSAGIFDPTTLPRTPFGGNVIPANRLDPIAMRLIQLYPLPNGPGLANNYSSVTDRTQNLDTTDFRVDHRFSGNNSLFARYSYNRVNTFTPGACPIVDGVDPNCIVGGIAAGGAFPGPNKTIAHNWVASYVRVFNPSLIGEFKGGYNHPKIASLPANYGKNLGKTYGIPNTNFGDSTSGFPLMNTVGYALLGDAQAVPLVTQDSSYQVAASITKTSGPHNIKMGAGAVLREFSVNQSISPVGVFTFDTLATNNGAGAGGNTIASFLLGYPSQVVRAYNPFDPKYHTNEPSAYVQDDWRATSRLTVNLGVRYDVFTPFTEAGNHLSNFDPASKKMLVAGDSGISKTAGVKTDLGDIAPRFGLAWTLPAQMVLRGGWGLSYFPGNVASPSYLKNPPFTANYGPIISTAASNGTPNVRLGDGLPPLATNSLSDLSGALIATALDFKANRVQQFNMILEKELGGNVVSAGYVGSRGDQLATNPNINLAPAGAGAVQPRRPFATAYPNVSNIAVFLNQGESHYDAMQLVFQRRYNAGVSFNTHYTLAHATSLGPTAWDWQALEWSDSANDIRHRWVGTANYDIPWGRDLKGVAGGVLAGWQVNLSAFWQSGLPFTVTNAAARMNTGGADRPDMVADPNLPSDQRTLQKWFNTAAFVAQPQFVAGNTPGTVLHGPANRSLNASFFKNLKLRGETHLQLRAEIYNLTNVANFVNPNSQLGNPAFGSISSTGNSTPRQMQFAAKYIF